MSEATGSESWAQLRQFVIAAADIESAGRQLRERLWLPKGFADVELEARGLADDAMPLGSGQFLEVVSPIDDSSPVHRFVAKKGAGAGYCLAVQVPSSIEIAARAVEMGLRVPIEVDFQGHHIIQLHPAEVGILLEFDGIPDRDQWFWDGIAPPPSPEALVHSITGVEVGATDPVALAALWAELAQVSQPTPTSVDFGTTITFVEAETSGIRGVTFELTPGATAPAPETLLGVHLTYH